MHGNGGVFELDNNFYPFALGAGGKVQQGMLVEAQLREDAVQSRSGGFGHMGIVKQVALR
jgi:hypothetical protein